MKKNQRLRAQHVAMCLAKARHARVPRLAVRREQAPLAGWHGNYLLYSLIGKLTNHKLILHWMLGEQSHKVRFDDLPEFLSFFFLLTSCCVSHVLFFFKGRNMDFIDYIFERFLAFEAGLGLAVLVRK